MFFFFFLLPCSFQSPPLPVVVGREPFSILRGEALQIATNREGDGMEKKWDKGGKGRMGGAWGGGETRERDLRRRRPRA